MQKNEHVIDIDIDKFGCRSPGSPYYEWICLVDNSISNLQFFKEAFLSHQ